MSLLDSPERRRRRSLAVLALLTCGAVIILVGVAALAVFLVRDDEPGPTPAAPAPTVDAEPTPAADASPAPDAAIRLVEPADVTAAVGSGWPAGHVGAVSAAADYTTASTIDLGVLRLRLDAMYADEPASAAEIDQIVQDTERGRANLGVPPGEPAGSAQVLLDPQAATYRAAGSGAVEGYVLVRRQLVTYVGDRLPADLLPVPFVVRRVDGDWRLTGDRVSWLPPAVPSGRADLGEGGWRALLPPR